MSLQRFFFWFGGKLRSSSVYPPPLHDTIIEPFAGSAGYATRYHRRKVILVEKDPAIAALWRYLIKVTARELLALPDLGDRDADELKVSAEARLLIRYNCARGTGAMGGKRLTSWDRECPHSSWGPTRRAQLTSQVERIRHWKVIEGDYTLAPDVVADWFVDPPYAGALGEHYRCKGSELDFRRARRLVPRAQGANNRMRGRRRPMAAVSSARYSAGCHPAQRTRRRWSQ